MSHRDFDMRAAGEPLPNRRARAMALATMLLAIGVALVVVARAPDPPRTAPNGSEGAAVAAPTPAREAGAVPNPVEPTRTGILGTIEGVVRDHRGEPLAKIPVLLRRQGTHPAPGRRRAVPDPLVMPAQVPWPTANCETDAGGGFRFVDLEAAEYSVAASLGTTAKREVVLAAGAHETVELRFAATELLLHGHVRCAGAPLADYRFELEQGRTLRLWPDAEGRYRTVVAAGPCAVTVRRSLPGGQTVTVARRELFAEVAAGDLCCDFELSSARLTAVLADPSRGGEAPFQFVVRGDCGVDGETIEIAVAADENGEAALDLPFGAWQVTARGRCLVAAASVDVELTPLRPAGQAIVAAERAGLVRVRAVDLDGRRIRFDDRCPVLIVNGVPRQGVDLRPDGRRMTFLEDFGFERVPAGPAELVFADREVDGEITYLAFDPPEARRIEVVPGDRNRIELRVERRALVKLRAVDRVGRDDGTAQVRVLAGDRVVTSMETRARRWRSWLPPGEYRVVVQRSTGRKESGLVVGRRDLDYVLRP